MIRLLPWAGFLAGVAGLAVYLLVRPCPRKHSSGIRIDWFESFMREEKARRVD